MTDSTNQRGKRRRCSVPLNGKASESPDDLDCGKCQIALAEEQKEGDKF